MAVEKPHKKLDAWKESVVLAVDMYSLTAEFPKSEMYGLISQMRRAAVSIGSNIAEGAARNSKKEFIRFLYIAHGSLAELDTQCVISQKLGFVPDEKNVTLTKQIETVGKLIYGLINYLKKQE